MTAMPNLFTVPEAAAELSLSPGTLRAWISRRRIEFVRLGRSVRVPRAEIQRLLEAGRVPAIPQECR